MTAANQLKRRRGGGGVRGHSKVDWMGGCVAAVQL